MEISQNFVAFSEYTNFNRIFIFYFHSSSKIVSLEKKSMVSFDLNISINSINMGLYPLQFSNAPVPLTFICILQLKNLHYVSTQELSTYYVGELFWSAFRWLRLSFHDAIMLYNLQSKSCNIAHQSFCFAAQTLCLSVFVSA